MGSATPTPTPHHKMSAIAAGGRGRGATTRRTLLQSLLLLKNGAIFLFVFLIAAGPILHLVRANPPMYLVADDVVELIECYQRFFPMTGDPFDYTKKWASSSSALDEDKLILGRHKGEWIESCIYDGGQKTSSELKEFYSVSISMYLSLLYVFVYFYLYIFRLQFYRSGVQRIVSLSWLSHAQFTM